MFLSSLSKFYGFRNLTKISNLTKKDCFKFINQPLSTTFSLDSRFGHNGESLSQKKYWESCYNEKQINNEFDWLLDSNTVSHDVISCLENSKGQKILDLGCGNSSVSQKIIEKYCHAVNVHGLDYIPSVIDHQVKVHGMVKQGHPSSCFVGVIGDACALPYRDNIFDIIIDKGTMDSLLKDNIKVRRQKKTTLFLKESLRVLAPGGSFLQFTDEDPDIHHDALWSLISHLGLQRKFSLSCKLVESIDIYGCYMYSIKKLLK